jgi:hypothetical protein
MATVGVFALTVMLFGAGLGLAVVAVGVTGWIGRPVRRRH